MSGFKAWQKLFSKHDDSNWSFNSMIKMRNIFIPSQTCSKWGMWMPYIHYIWSRTLIISNRKWLILKKNFNRFFVNKSVRFVINGSILISKCGLLLNIFKRKPISFVSICFCFHFPPTIIISCFKSNQLIILVISDIVYRKKSSYFPILLFFSTQFKLNKA